MVEHLELAVGRYGKTRLYTESYNTITLFKLIVKNVIAIIEQNKIFVWR